MLFMLAKVWAGLLSWALHFVKDRALCHHRRTGKENNPFGYWHTNVREFAMPFTFRLGKIQKNYIIFHISDGVCLRQDLHPPGRKYFRVLQNVPSLWWTTWSSLSNRLNAPFSFLQVFFLIVGVVCPLSQKRTPFAAHSLGEKRALGNSLSFAIWNVMLIPNYSKSNHKVWWKKKKKALRRILKASSKKKCFWGNHSLVADIFKKPGGKLFSEFPELCSVPALSRWHMS